MAKFGRRRGLARPEASGILGFPASGSTWRQLDMISARRAALKGLAGASGVAGPGRGGLWEGHWSRGGRFARLGNLRSTMASTMMPRPKKPPRM